MSERSWESISSEFDKVLKKSKYQKKIAKTKKTSLLIAVGIGCLIIWFMGARWIYRGVTGADEKEAKEELLAKCGCSSVDDCIEKNNTECAWKILNQDESLVKDEDKMKIIKAESIGFIKKGEFKKGWQNLSEQNFEYFQNDLIAYKYEYLNLVIDELLEDGEINKAKVYAMKASDEHNIEGWLESETNDFNKNKTQRKLLLKKISAFN